MCFGPSTTGRESSTYRVRLSKYCRKCSINPMLHCMLWDQAWFVLKSHLEEQRWPPIGDVNLRVSLTEATKTVKWRRLCLILRTDVGIKRSCPAGVLLMWKWQEPFNHLTFSSSLLGEDNHSPAACHTSRTFWVASCQQQSDKQLILLVTELWSLLPLTPALSDPLTTENMCGFSLKAFHSHKQSHYSEVRELWEEVVPLMESHDFLSWLSFALSLPPSDTCRCAAVLLNTLEERKQKPKKGRLDILRGKRSGGRHMATHLISESVPDIQLKWCSTFQKATNHPTSKIMLVGPTLGIWEILHIKQMNLKTAF